MQRELVLGPQDGAKVCSVGRQGMPDTIYVGPKWLGDGFAAWGFEESKRFPEPYHLCDDGKYYHAYKLVSPSD